MFKVAVAMIKYVRILYFVIVIKNVAIIIAIKGVEAYEIPLGWAHSHPNWKHYLLGRAF